MAKRAGLPLSVFLALLGLTALAASAKVDLFGYYYLPEEEVPHGFREIDHLHLSTIAMRGERMVEVPLHGWIRTKAVGRMGAADYALVSLSLKGRDLTFETRTVKGVSYRFSGAFARLGDFPNEQPAGEVMLRGRLTKLQGGKVVAESAVGFLYTGGG
jgi:hypothetical protein